MATTGQAREGWRWTRAVSNPAELHRAESGNRTPGPARAHRTESGDGTPSPTESHRAESGNGAPGPARPRCTGSRGITSFANR